MTNGKILGLDIGIASVGVGIIEAKTGKVVHANSRLFLLQMQKIIQSEEDSVAQDA